MTVTPPERGFQVLENTFIALRDGRRLSARIWLPDIATRQPVPAILEYLPYRKRDGTAARDESTYPVFAAAGYAGVRVDISGTGESDGDFDDEYSPRELSDGEQVIEWIASRPWCSGAVGMMGISWGGFNALQIAALRPPALKAVIAIGTTVDRYNDDIHYKNGCLLYSNFWWSAVMLCYASRPPDPLLVGDRWRDLWLHRLTTQPFPLQRWLAHQRRDGYWRHGSVCEDYGALAAPALVISGWADGYINAPPAAAANLRVCARAINGPWIHNYPHFALPHPRMDFHAEALRWWDRWLKGIHNDAESLPAYRAFISQQVRPVKMREEEAGRWVAEPCWPPPGRSDLIFHLAPGARLSGAPPEAQIASICSPLDCGTGCGELFTLKVDSELPGDQRLDDAGSLTFETDPLAEPVEILGRPRLRLRVAIDRPVGHLAVRLVDVHPDGVGFRVSWGVLNLTHRDGNERPRAMTPGVPVDVELLLDECGYHFAAGHRLRVSISTAYWPMVMPPPAVVTASVSLGAGSFVALPVRAGGDEYPVPPPRDPDPLPHYPVHGPAQHGRTVQRDLQNRCTRYRVVDDGGEQEVPGHGMRSRHRHESSYLMALEDPCGARAHSVHTCWMSRAGWSIRTESESRWWCDATHFHMEATVRAFDGDVLVNDRHWQGSIERDLM